MVARRRQRRPAATTAGAGRADARGALGDPARRAARAAYTPGTHGWLQVNCTLFPQGMDAPLYVPWAGLHTALQTWRAERRFERCFFMRKPPGLRLRFQGSHLGARLEPTLVAWLEEAERRNDIRGFRFAVYEPERFRFGGPAGMDVAHEYFDRDSRLALRYEMLADDDCRSLPRTLYSLVATHDLFRRCVDDGAELWDVWRRLQMAVGHASAADVMGTVDAAWVPEAVTLAPSFRATLTPAAAALLQDVDVHNAAIAARLHGASVARRLTIGMRAWLGAASVFHWNRLGLTLPELQAMVARMLRLLDPEDALA
jgi:thiopeptide-type bacteriocin biosynthesis protein